MQQNLPICDKIICPAAQGVIYLQVDLNKYNKEKYQWLKNRSFK